MDRRRLIIKRIGDRIRTKRRIKGLTLRDIAEKVGCSVSTLSKMERGDRELGFYSMLKVLSILGYYIKLKREGEVVKIKYEE